MAFSRTVELGPIDPDDTGLLEQLREPEHVDFDNDSPSRDAEGVLKASLALHHIRDLDTMLEHVLYTARKLTAADAGTIYLKSKNRLFFTFVQNDSLFAGRTADSRYVYSENSLPIDRSSLAGYAATSQEPVLVDDVYDIQSNVSYAFNPEFDAKTSYRTQSMLIVPLLTRDQSMVGVLQLINALDESGNVISFSYRDSLIASYFGQNAADAIERAKLSREMVLRMVEMSGLRDPFETAQHAKRVASYSVELYEKWATAHGVAAHEIRHKREIMRTAAMLHDVGKAAISDTILRKGNNLTPDEAKKMQLHTIYGARLFKRDDSPWDLMAREVTLNHHERWDGTGYPGHTDNIFGKKIRVGRPKRGKEIPVSARIVQIADVFDALSTKRAYKEAWPLDDVQAYLRANASKRFDPELVQMFLGMPKVIESIAKKYSY